MAELRLESISDLDAVRPEWSALAETSGNLFGTWEWLATWWRHFSEGQELLATACRAPDGGLRAVLPLYVAAVRPVRTLRFMGNGVSDRLHPICAPGDRVAAAHAVRRALADSGWEWGVFFAEDMPAAESWPTLIPGRRWGRIADPAIEFEVGIENWDDYLASRSSHFRQNLRYRERKLVRDRGLRFRLADDPDRLDDDFDIFCRLHELRFAGESSSFRGRLRDFHRDFAHQALHRGWLRLWFLELEGQPAAAWYGFRFGGAEWFYNGGRDPSWGRAADGYLLMVHSIRTAVDDGIRRYLYLRGDNPYKERFANVEGALESVALVQGAKGRAALAIASGNTALRRRQVSLPGPAGRLARRFDEWSLVAGRANP